MTCRAALEDDVFILENDLIRREYAWNNGHLHSLIIAGSAVSAGNISATEQWVAGKTGIQI